MYLSPNGALKPPTCDDSPATSLVGLGGEEAGGALAGGAARSSRGVRPLGGYWRVPLTFNALQSCREGVASPKTPAWLDLVRPGGIKKVRAVSLCPCKKLLKRVTEQCDDDGLSGRTHDSCSMFCLCKRIGLRKLLK